MNRRLLTSWAVLAFCLAWLGVEGGDLQPPVDDAYISFRYAGNLIDGHGLVYNPGEYVEGYTNLLWTLLVAAGMWLGFAGPEAAHGLSLAACTLALLATYGYARTGLSAESRWVAAGAPLLLMSSVGFPIWSFSGMETPLFTALVTVALAAEADRKIVWATVAAALATLTRPEGALLAGLILISALFSDVGRSRKRALAATAGYAAILTGLTAFRLHYYDSLLPNTFYAKVGGQWLGFGAIYLIEFLMSGVSPLLLPVAWAVRNDRRSRVGGAWILAMAVYVVWIDGDALGGHRFLVPTLPAIAALSMRAIGQARERDGLGMVVRTFWTCVATAICWTMVTPGVPMLILLGAVAAALAGVWGRFWFAAALTVVVLTVGALTWPAADPKTDSGRAQLLRRYRNMVTTVGFRSTEVEGHLRIRRFVESKSQVTTDRLLRRQKQEGAIQLIASSGIGKLGYETGIPILDLLGLTDRIIAHSGQTMHRDGVAFPGHSRGDASYVLGRRPDYIIIPRESSPLDLPAHLALREHPDFHRSYDWDRRVGAYKRKK